MAPSKKKKKSKRGQGSSGSGGRDDEEIPGSMGVDIEDLDIIDIDPYRPTETAHVEVVYAEEHLRRRQEVPSHGLIRDSWLEQCTQDSLQHWGPDLVGVDKDDLVGRVVPPTAKSYTDLAPGKGLVLVEMTNKNKGLVGQLRSSRASVLQLQDTLQDSTAQIQSLLEEYSRREAARAEDTRRQMREEMREVQQQLQVHIADKTAMQLRIEELEKQTHDLTLHFTSLRSFMQKGVDLSNKVKKRVALTLARNAIEVALERVRESGETWSSFFQHFTEDDWDRVGVERRLVRRLLADGAHAFNDSIHEIPAEEVVGSIASMPLGSLWSAWEEIFYLAFQIQVSDEIFRGSSDFVTF